LDIGPIDEIVGEQVLSQLYGIPVEVASVGGHRIVLARRGNGRVHTHD
jgi:hypothetical protein